ncbi:MAG: hypothetical protein JRN52_07875 [Nitrososphaerota archaeon]|nr:hypothetical protein [Nitrososphaerota archaeon]
MTGSRSGDKVRQKTVAYLGPLYVLTFGIPKSVREKGQSYELENQSNGMQYVKRLHRCL